MKETTNDYLVSTKLNPNSTSEQLIEKEKKFCVYFITNIILDKHYIGYSSRLGPNPIDNLGVNGIKYCSSSTDEAFKKDQKENPDNYFYYVIDSFDTKEEAITLEVELHNRYNVRVNESFYNKAKQTSTGFDTTGMVNAFDTVKKINIQVTKEEFAKDDNLVGVNKGKHCTNVTKKNQSDAQTGKNNPMYGKRGKDSPNYGSKRSDATRKKQSIAQTGEKNHMWGKSPSDETKKKQSDALIGIKQKIVKCPYCDKEGGISNMKRYHFNNCK